MSTSSHWLEEAQKKTRYSLNHDEDESAARTRPLTFEEIMTRRKRKTSEKYKDTASRKRDITNDLSSQTIKSDRPRKDYLPAGERRGVSVKERNISPGRREKITYVDAIWSDGNVQKGIDAEVPTLRRKLKSVVSRPRDNVGDEIEGGKDDKAVRDQRENEKQCIVSRASDNVRDGLKGENDNKQLCDNKEREKQPVVFRPSYDVRDGMKAVKDDKGVRDKKESQKHSVVSRPGDDVGDGIKGYRDDKRVHDKTKKKKSSSDHARHEHGKWYSRDWRGNESHDEQNGGNYESEERRKRKYRDYVDVKKQEIHTAKKPDTRKHYKKQAPERNKRKGSLQRTPDEPKTRRRSSSRDRGNRHKRSKSPLTIAHKRPSHNRRADREASQYALKDDSKNENHSDRKKLLINSSGGHYRRKDEGKSGLGGYSPRKRSSEAAAKTPSSPDQLSSEKKSAKWGILPPDPEINKMLSGPVISSFQPFVTQELTTKAHVFSTYAKLPSSLMAAPLPTKTCSSVDSIQLTQSTRPMRRLYVDNIPSSTLDKDLVKWLNYLFLSAGVNHIPGTQPCINCIINKDKAQALVEFLTPEDASTALAFDGRSISGSALKMRRPRDFVDVATDNLDESAPIVDTLSNVVTDSPNKIFIAGISKALSSKSLMEIVCVFGPLKAYHFEVNVDLNEPCAFLEYVDQSVTVKACAGLNGMKIGGKVLTVVQAVQGAETLAESSMLYKIPQHAKLLLKQPTQVLRLENVLNVEDISAQPESEVEEVLEDIRLECSRFGNVKSINFIKQHNNDAQIADLNQNIETQNLDQHKNIEPNKIELVYSKSNFKDLPIDEVGKDNSVENKSPQPSQAKSKTEPIIVLDEPCNQLNSPKHDQRKNKGDIVPMDAENSRNQTRKNPNTGTNSEMVNINDHSPTIEFKVEARDLDAENVFEMGCVFVEFIRAEAACAMAHCLHGRVFDAKTVSVEYIALDHYKSRFPKKTKN